MGVCGNFKDRQSPLEDMLSKIVAGKDGADVSALHMRYSELCDAMIDGLVDASDFLNFVSLIGQIIALSVLTNTRPEIDGCELYSNYPPLRCSLSAYHNRHEGVDFTTIS